MDYTAPYPSPLGTMTMASDGTHLIGLWFDGQKYFGSTLSADPEERPDLPIFGMTRKWLNVYFGGDLPSSVPPIHLRLGAFRRLVCERLLAIPYGETTTYGEMGRIIAIQRGGASLSAQAIGGAVGHNPISLIIPCHRVVAANGSLCGYAGGLERKAFLLDMEKRER